MKSINLLISFILLLLLNNLNSQQNKLDYHVKFSPNEIIIDGIADENSWKTANKMNANWQHFPNETNDFNNPTEVRILFDNENIYLLCKSFSKTNDYVIPSLKWDFSGAASDKVNFLFDTFSDGNNAYMFGSNMLGVKSDILVANGGIGSSRSDLNRTWNGNFDVEGKVCEGYYLIEMKIPLSTFNYPENSKSWRFNFFRFDTEENQRTTWARIPQEFKDYNLAFMGEIFFERPLNKSKGKTWLIPFINGFTENDFLENKSENDFKYGLDIRLPLKSELNLDVTFNSDFSQAEIDDEIVNFTRFEFKMPEKRQFFVENNDIYTNFGENLMMNPFFSRRIGLAKNSQGDLIENKILSGIRISGKINNNLKLGFLNMLTDEDLSNNIPMNLNSVISLHQRVFKRSLVKFIFVNRQNTQDYEFVSYEDQFNRVAGIEYDLITEKNKWNGRAYFYKSFENVKKDDNNVEKQVGKMDLYRSSTTSTTILNDPGHWDYFISHAQKDGAVLAEGIWSHMKYVKKKTCWFDVKMDKRNKAAMKEGVKNSKFFLTIVSETYFERPFCIKELEWAMEYKKPMVVVIDVKLKNDIGRLLNKCPEHLRNIGNINFIDLNRGDREYWEVGMKKIIKAKPRILKKQIVPLVQTNIKNNAADLLRHYSINIKNYTYLISINF